LLWERYRTVLASGKAESFRLELPEPWPRRVAECHVVPERDDVGAVTSVIALFTDATEEVREKAEAHASAQRLRAVLGHMPGFCYTVDKNLAFTSSAGVGLGHLNLAEGQVIGMTLAELWGTNDPTYEPFACHLRALSGEAQTYQDVCLGRSLEYRLLPLRDLEGGVIGVIGVGLDVTDLELAKEERGKLAAQLRQAQKLEAIGRLAGGVAHDFNNLLTCILGNLTLAESRMDADSPVLRHLTVASSAAESASTLTRQLLAFSRKQVIEPRPLNLSELIDRVRGMLERLIGESIALSTSFAPDLWYVQADPGQLEQVLVNLIVNARDAITGHGEIRIETRNLDVGSSDDIPSHVSPGKYVVLSVEDTGRGMSDIVRARLFEPFFTTKETGEGTGLGLATVYGAVQQNGGTITVESELGRGSTFQIFLPRLEVDPASLVPPEIITPPPPSHPRGGSETILLVEDEPLVLELAHCALQELGYKVLACASADEALRTFTDYVHPIDILVTDVVMPRMNGRELAARMASLRPGIAVLFTSGYGEDIIARQGVLEAGLHFIEKPYRLSDLSTKVRDILDTRARASGRVSAA
jgi:signal transduction histidine kinase/CheY-like chemotaxis protein